MDEKLFTDFMSGTSCEIPYMSGLADETLLETLGSFDGKAFEEFDEGIRQIRH